MTKPVKADSSYPADQKESERCLAQYSALQELKRDSEADDPYTLPSTAVPHECQWAGCVDGYQRRMTIAEASVAAVEHYRSSDTSSDFASSAAVGARSSVVVVVEIEGPLLIADFAQQAAGPVGAAGHEGARQR